MISLHYLIISQKPVILTEFEVPSTRYMIWARLQGPKNSMGKVDIYSLLWLQSGWVQDTADCFISE